MVAPSDIDRSGGEVDAAIVISDSGPLLSLGRGVNDVTLHATVSSWPIVGCSNDGNLACDCDQNNFDANLDVVFTCTGSILQNSSVVVHLFAIPQALFEGQCPEPNPVTIDATVSTSAGERSYADNFASSSTMVDGCPLSP